MNLNAEDFYPPRSFCLRGADLCFIYLAGHRAYAWGCKKSIVRAPPALARAVPLPRGQHRGDALLRQRPAAGGGRTSRGERRRCRIIDMSALPRRGRGDGRRGEGHWERGQRGGKGREGGHISSSRAAVNSVDGLGC